MPRAAVEPVRVKQHDPDLGCERLKVIGFRGRCGDHWIGERRDLWAEACADAIEHNKAEHAP